MKRLILISLLLVGCRDTISHSLVEAEDAACAKNGGAYRYFNRGIDKGMYTGFVHCNDGAIFENISAPIQ